LQIEELNRLNWRTAFDEQAIPDLTPVDLVFGVEAGW
jgi:hypothetical protein